MRLQNTEFKGGFSTANLYYQSVCWLNKNTFGHARLTREVTDAWIERRFSHGGHSFTMQPPELTEQELQSIPGASNTQVDKLKCEVLERSGPGVSSFNIKTDEHKYWSMQGGEIGTLYNSLRERHLDLIGRANSGARGASNGGSEEVEEQANSQQEKESVLTEMESFAKLETSCGIDCKCNSEVSNVELVLGKDGSCWLLASSDKSLGKHVVLGGFGRGQWISAADPNEGIDYTSPCGDQTLVQLDESSFSSEGSGITTSSLFKLLTRAEREKGVVDHKMSFLTIVRKSESEIESAGGDGFNVTVKSAMKFRCLRDPRSFGTGTGQAEERVTAKNFFSKIVGNTANIYRFERVGQNYKVQRPYIITSKPLTLKKDKPVKIIGSPSSTSANWAKRAWVCPLSQSIG